MRGFRIYTQKETKNLEIEEVSDAQKEVCLHKKRVTKISCIRESRDPIQAMYSKGKYESAQNKGLRV